MSFFNIFNKKYSIIKIATHEWKGLYDEKKNTIDTKGNTIYRAKFTEYDNGKIKQVFNGRWTGKIVNECDFIGQYSETNTSIPIESEYKWINIKYSEPDDNNKITISCIVISKKNFIETYNSFGNIDAYKKLLKFIDMGYYENGVNILIGCTNRTDSDYYRFKDSGYYSLYLDIDI